MVQEKLKFLKTHEWIEAEGKRRKVGISDFAQSQLGDIIYVEFTDEGKQVAAGDEVCIVESCKATASVYAPLAGTVVAFNRLLESEPEKVNESPYEEGWFFELDVDDDPDEAALLGHEAYLKGCNEE